MKHGLGVRVFCDKNVISAGVGKEVTAAVLIKLFGVPRAAGTLDVDH
jgi:hypothetical protein